MPKTGPLHGWYWVLPVITALLWFADLVTMLGLWAHQGHRRYKDKEPMPPYISDVGAANHHTFEALSIATAAMYMITILTERYLRHRRRIPGSISKQSTRFDIACVVFTIIGCLGLIFLSIFDAFDYSTAHWTMTVVFIVGLLLGVFFQCCEIYSLAHSHQGYSKKVFQTLFTISAIKTSILCIAIAVAIAFAVLYVHCDGDRFSTKHDNCSSWVNAASGCEWTVAFILFVYFFTHVADFWDARHRYNLNVDGSGYVDYKHNGTRRQPLGSDTASDTTAATHSAQPYKKAEEGEMAFGQEGTYAPPPPVVGNGATGHYQPSAPAVNGGGAYPQQFPAAPVEDRGYGAGAYAPPAASNTVPMGTYAPPAGAPPPAGPQRWVA